MHGEWVVTIVQASDSQLAAETLDDVLLAGVVEPGSRNVSSRDVRLWVENERFPAIIQQVKILALC